MTLACNINKKQRDFRMTIGIVLLWSSLYVLALWMVNQSHFLWAYPPLVVGLIASVEAIQGHCVVVGVSEKAHKASAKRKHR